MLRDHLLAHGVKAETDRWTDSGDLSAIEALFASRAAGGRRFDRGRRI
ncbi:hypothetical protein [Mesorhizobium huakuii]|nr:hypothetical protein [Mesorhizobium huakuii]